MTNNSLLIWDWSNNTIVFTLPWFYSTPSNIKYLRSNLLAAPASASSIKIWDVTTGQLKFTLSGGVYDFELLMNGTLVTTGADNLIKTWSPTSGQQISQISVSASLYVLKQINATTLLGGSSSGYIYAWSLSTLQMSLSWAAYVSPSASAVTFLDLTPNGFLVSATQTGSSINVWNLATSSSVLTSVGSLLPGVNINCVKIISSSLIVFGVNSNYVQFASLSQTGGLTVALKVYLAASNSKVLDMSLTAEMYLVICQNDGSVTFLNVNTSTFVLGLTPIDSSAFPAYLELIGIRIGSC
jgi:hypothetical protein